MVLLALGAQCQGGDGDGTGTRLERAPASSPTARRKEYAFPCDGRLQRAPSVGDDEPGLSATYLQGPVIPVLAHTLVGCRRCIQLCLLCTAHNAHTMLWGRLHSVFCRCIHVACVACALLLTDSQDSLLERILRSILPGRVRRQAGNLIVCGRKRHEIFCEGF